MAATTLVREVLRRVSSQVQDLSPQFIRFPERECVDWLNDGQMAIWKYLPLAASRVDVIKLKPGTRQSIELIAAGDCKPGDGSVPLVPIIGTQILRGSMRNMGADGLTPGKAIRLVSHDDMDSQNPDWHTAMAAGSIKAITYNPETPRYFYNYPPVPALVMGAVWIEIPYTSRPIQIPNIATVGSEAYLADGSSSVVISIGDEHADDLTDYMLARLYLKNAQGLGNAERAATHASRCLGSLNAKVAAITGNNPNLKMLPFAPTPVGQAL